MVQQHWQLEEVAACYFPFSGIRNTLHATQLGHAPTLAPRLETSLKDGPVRLILFIVVLSYTK